MPPNTINTADQKIAMHRKVVVIMTLKDTKNKRGRKEERHKNVKLKVAKGFFEANT